MSLFKNIIRNFYIRINHRRIPKLSINHTNTISIKSHFSGYNKLGNNTAFHGFIGKYSYIGSHAKISAKIGNFWSIADDVETIQATHPIEVFVSTHPVFYSELQQCGTTFVLSQAFDEFRYKFPEEKIAIEIGNDVWIGKGAKLIGGIKIGTGAVILPYSVVTKDVSPYAIVGGIPAKFLRYRFSELEIKELFNSNWWNWSEDIIKDKLESFHDISLFITNHRNKATDEG